MKELDEMLELLDEIEEIAEDLDEDSDEEEVVRFNELVGQASSRMLAVFKGAMKQPFSFFFQRENKQKIAQVRERVKALIMKKGLLADPEAN